MLVEVVVIVQPLSSAVVPMDHYAMLDQLPKECRFPAELEDRISYDADRKQLVYHGPMSKCTFDKLWQLSPSPEYRRAIEKLFHDATYSAEQKRQTRVPLLLVTGITIIAIVIGVAVLWFIIRSVQQPSIRS